MVLQVIHRRFQLLPRIVKEQYDIRQVTNIFFLKVLLFFIIATNATNENYFIQDNLSYFILQATVKMEPRDHLIEKYFGLGLQQKEIITLLKNIHGITIHPRSLKRILRKKKLYRRKYFSNLEHVANFIEDQIMTSGQLHGYRWMHLKCIQHGLIVTQDIVRELLNLFDPVGADLRRRKRLRRRQYSNDGPNSVWHMDSYDKLKPYGICINGAVDGFSRYIIWMHAGRTSNDPKVIASYYVNSLKALGGFPMTVRSDMGTENGVCEKIQKALRELFVTDGNHKPAFLYGRSTANQRIESWWSILRKQNAQFWINLFEVLKDEGLFNGTFVDKSLIQFCFLKIIQVNFIFLFI